MPGLLSSQPLLPAFEIVDRRPPRCFAKSPPIYSAMVSILLVFISLVLIRRTVTPSFQISPSASFRPVFCCVCLSSALLPPLTPPRQLPCSPSPRRRPKVCAQSQHRRRHRSRVDYRSESFPLHPFDKLPWIASLDASDNAHPADFADLSQLPDPTLLHIRPSGPGPIRRRKPSLRSNPLLPPPSVQHPAHANNNDDDNDHLFHEYTSNLSTRDTPSRPSTPTHRPDFDHTRVTFRHLMPVFDPSSDDDDV